jgi:hypothetical protein
LIDDGALLQANDLGTEEQGFLYVVGDGEDGDVVLGGMMLHAGQEGIAEGSVEAGEGLVEEDQVRGGDGEGAGEIHALALAAGEVAREAVG